MCGQRRDAAAIDDEIMPFRFSANRFIDGVGDQVVAFACPKGRTKVCGVFLAKAHVQRARTSKPYAVTGFAEVMGHRRDKTDSSTGFDTIDVARRTAGGMVAFV